MHGFERDKLGSQNSSQIKSYLISKRFCDGRFREQNVSSLIPSQLFFVVNGCSLFKKKTIKIPCFMLPLKQKQKIKAEEETIKKEGKIMEKERKKLERYRQSE